LGKVTPPDWMTIHPVSGFRFPQTKDYWQGILGKLWGQWRYSSVNPNFDEDWVAEFLTFLEDQGWTVESDKPINVTLRW
jgi:hypothetical protein